MADGMNLDEYVRETLLAIIKGVTAAQNDPECGGYVGRAAYGANTLMTDNSENVLSNVQFDLATTVEDRQQTGGGIGVKVIPFIQANASGKLEGSQSTVSRIAFSVPIAIPQPVAQKEERTEWKRKMGGAWA